MNKGLTPFQHAYSWLLLAFLGVLSISGTVALRNLILLSLMLMSSWALAFAPDRLTCLPSSVFKKIPKLLFVWIGFLVLFPLWAIQPDVALANLSGQWLQYAMTWFIAYGTILVLGERGPSLWALALASAVPVFLHLLLTLLASAGLLSPAFYAEPSFPALLDSFRSIISGSLTLHWQSPPSDFHGVEPMHGNIGYAASQTIALCCVCFLIAWRERSFLRIALSMSLILICFLSVIIAASRGAVYFGFLLLVISLFAFVRTEAKLNNRPRLTILDASTAKLITVCILVLICVSSFVYVKARNDVRWYSMTDKMSVGWTVENPIDTLCNGLSGSELKKIRQTYKAKGDDYTQALIKGLEGQDGGRILLMRAGIQLVLENPIGLDGSRWSYAKLMVQKCGQQPKLQFSHAHQAWINLALAFGWLGVVLFGAVMVYFLVFGWRYIGNPTQWPWAMALFLISIFWILRGMADAVYQDHYLQMQALLLGYLFARFWAYPNFSCQPSKKAYV